MNIDAFKTIQQIRQEDIHEYNEFFATNIFFNRKAADDVWNALDEQCRSMNEATQFQYRQTYFGWYTQLTWKRLASLPEEFFLEEVVAKQIPTAYLKNVSVLDQMLWYIQIHSYEEYTQQKLYEQVVQKIKQSPAILGKNKEGIVVLFRDFIRKFQLLHSTSQRDSMQIAELYNEFQREYFGGIDLQKESPPVLPENVSDYLFSFLKFITDIAGEDVPLMIDMLTDPFKYDIVKEQPKQNLNSQSNKDSFSVPAEDLSSDSFVQEPISNDFFSELSLHKSDFITWITEDNVRNSLLDALQKLSDPIIARITLASELQKIFPNIHEDMNTAGAIVELDSFLQENGLGGDADFLYFDDTDAGFYWDPRYIQS